MRSLKDQAKSFTLADFTRIYVYQLWPWYLLGSVALMATNFITLKVPLYCRDIINGLENQSLNGPHQNLALSVTGLGFLLIIVRSLSRVLIFWPGRNIEQKARHGLFSKALNATHGFLLNIGSGDLISRLSSDLMQLRVFYAFGVLQGLNLIFLFAFAILQMLHIHQGLSILALLPTTIMLGLTRYLWPKMQKVAKENQDAVGRLSQKLTEAFVHVHTIKTAAVEESFIARAEQENRTVFLSGQRLNLLRTAIFPMMGLMTDLAQAFVFIYGSLEVLKGRLSIGDILAFNIYLSYLSFPLTALGIILSVLQRAQTAIKRLAPIYLSPQENDIPLEDQQQKLQSPYLLEIKDLVFSYPPSGTRDQRPFKLSIPELKLQRGQKIGIYGPIGAGKTTLFALLSALVDLPQGQIFLNGRDLSTLAPRQLRASIAYGLQSVQLYSDSIRTNLNLGLSVEPSTAKLMEALSQAALSKDLATFPEGLDTQIGERGLRLSGGQKQRLALARLFLRTPELYLLDDVCSAVDIKTEQDILKSLARSDISMLISSHRPEVLRLCDQIIILAEGTIKTRGSYAKLLALYPEWAKES